MSAPWDNLPLDTFTRLPQLETHPDIQVWGIRNATGGGLDYRVQPGTPTANRLAIVAAIAAALARLRTIQIQAAAFVATANYGTANLANLNDLLAKSKLMAAAMSDIAADLVALVRLLSDQFDATS